MIVNLYVDHMMSEPATSSDDVWAATRDHSKLFSEAARRIGLTPAEYREFRTSLLDGNAMYVKLPRKLDAMSGNRRGSVYAVKNAVMAQPVMGWKVALADGNVVYVPQVCGNISLLRPVAVAHAAPKRKAVVAVVPHAAPKFVPAIGVAPETPVVFVPPPAVAPVYAAPAYAAAPVPLAAPAAAGGISPFFAAIPVIIGGIVAGATHGPTAVPPCSQGSNLFNACQK